MDTHTTCRATHTHTPTPLFLHTQCERTSLPAPGSRPGVGARAPHPPPLGLCASVSPLGLPGDPPPPSPEGAAGPCMGPPRASVSPVAPVLGAAMGDRGCCSPFPPSSSRVGVPGDTPSRGGPGGGEGDTGSSRPAAPANFWGGKSHCGVNELRPAPLIARVGRATAGRSPVAPGLRGAVATPGLGRGGG